MLAAPGDNVYVRSSKVVVDGAATPAVVGLAGRDGGPIVTSIAFGTGAPEDAIDLGDALIVPAPLDLHFHGAGGHVVPPGGEARSIDQALGAATEATTWRSRAVAPPAYEWVATLPIPGADQIDVVAEVAAAARAITQARIVDGTGCVGIRIEGCFLNPSRAGVWPPEFFHTPSIDLLERLHAASHGAGTPLLIVDLAPELLERDALIGFIRRARELDVIVSLAHTDATWEQARAAIDAGATLATHTWNAMRPITHRDPGVVAAVLVDERVTCELICDGVHLHPGTIMLSVAACGHDRWVAVSDASPLAGCAPGSYEWAGASVTHDGTALRDPAGRLAGSASLLWQAEPTLASAGIDQMRAALAIGALPRRVLDSSRTIGLHVGDPAWII